MPRRSFGHRPVSERRSAHPRSPVRSVTFRDLTLHTNDNSLFDARTDGLTIVLDRCRVTGWDCGAGGSVLLDGRGAAVWARDTRFEGGYGRHPDGGNLFRCSAHLGRFKGCTIEGPFRSVTNSGGRNASLYFDHCELVDLADRQVEELQDPPRSGATLVGSTATTRPGGVPEPPTRRDLADTNPA